MIEKKAIKNLYKELKHRQINGGFDNFDELYFFLDYQKYKLNYFMTIVEDEYRDLLIRFEAYNN